MTTAHSSPPARSLVDSFNRRLVLLGTLMTAAFLLVVTWAVFDRFETLEQRDVDTHFERADQLLAQHKQTIRAASLDWALWDETYQFLAGSNPQFGELNLDQESVTNLDVNGMAFFARDGSLHQAVYMEPVAAGLNQALAQRFAEMATPTVTAVRQADSQTVQGFAMLNDRLLVLSVARVMRSDGSGPSTGYLVMAREVPASELSSALGLAAQIDPVGIGSDAPVSRDLMQLKLARVVSGIDGSPVATLHFRAPRVLLQEGRRLLGLVALGALICGVFLVLAFGSMVRRLLLGPLRAFQQHVAAISSSGELLPYQGEQRDDELGRLYGEFNAMVAEMVALRSKVEAQSYLIGKRDNTASVMHNLGNAVGPIKTILSRLEGDLLPNAQRDVNRALDELAGGENAGSRKALLADFVRAALACEHEAASDRRDMVRTALRSVDTVEGIITGTMAEIRQQPVADEVCDIGPVVANCAALARQRDRSVAVTLACDGRFPVRANRVLLAQVFENLLKNAVEAISATGRGSGTITVTSEAGQPLDDRPAVRITIRDDGDGFAPDQGARLFERGFSSRAKDLGGIGLHWCANTISGMGGRLELTSDGPGQGACAIVHLPLAMDERADHARAA